MRFRFHFLTTAVLIPILIFAGSVNGEKVAEIVQTSTFNVPGNTGDHWLDTGIEVRANTLIRLQAKGRVNINKDTAGNYLGEVGPEGMPEARVPPSVLDNSPFFPADTENRYGLVAEVMSPDGLYEYWDYGSHPNYCTYRKGRLRLSVNDNVPDDNTGSFSVGLTLGGACPSSKRASAYSAAPQAEVRAAFRRREEASGAVAGRRALGK